MKKKIGTIILIIILLLSIPITAFAGKVVSGTDFDIQTGNGTTKNSFNHTIDEIIEEGRNFLEEGKLESTNQINEESLKKMSDTIFNILLAVGIVVAVVVAGILGIQFMAASTENKAKIKEALIIFIVGCCIVFGAFGIWKTVINIMSGIESSTTATK